MMSVLDLFSGIGGFSLGLERTGGFKTAAFCEIDPFCRRVLAKHWPEVPCYDDVRTLDAARLHADGVGRINVICGGFPCQPFSSASRGRRVAMDLWPEMSRVVNSLRPDYVIAENVKKEPIENAAKECRRFGYRAIIRNIGGGNVGADHIRSRWWLCAYPDHESELHCFVDAEVAGLQEVCRGLWGVGQLLQSNSNF